MEITSGNKVMATEKSITQSDSLFWKMFLGISMMCMALYLVMIGGTQVWADEAYTFSVIRHSFCGICKITAADVHPPLY